jgi:OFA family oxalate/formate antiporter-like MFS transporter
MRKLPTPHRWMVLLAFCLVNLCTGSVYSWSVFAAPMAERLSGFLGQTLSSGDLSIVFTVYSGMAILMIVVGGALNDRYSPRWILLFSGIMYAGGFLLSGMAHSLQTLILGYGVLCNIGGSLAYSCTIGNAVKFFPDRRGMAGGIVTAAYGMSSMLLSPVINHINTTMGVQISFYALGICFLVIICTCSFFTDRPPVQPVNISVSTEVSDATWRQMLRDRRFYVMYFIFFSAGFFGYMITSQAAAMGEHIGMSATSAAFGVSALSLANAAGRVSAGFLSDRLGRVNTLTIMLLIAIAGLLLLTAADHNGAFVFYIGILAVGLGFGSFMGVFPGFTTDQFGAKYSTFNYALMFTSFSIAGMLSPLLSGQIFSTYGTYVPAYLAAIGVCLVSLGLTFVFRLVTHCGLLPHRSAAS